MKKMGFIFLKFRLPISLMDATELTAIRTASGSALATKYLSNEVFFNLNLRIVKCY